MPNESEEEIEVIKFDDINRFARNYLQPATQMGPRHLQNRELI